MDAHDQKRVLGKSVSNSKEIGYIRGRKLIFLAKWCVYAVFLSSFVTYAQIWVGADC